MLDLHSLSTHFPMTCATSCNHSQVEEIPSSFLYSEGTGWNGTCLTALRISPPLQALQPGKHYCSLLPTDASDPGVSTARELSAVGESPYSDKGTGVPRVKWTTWALQSRCLPYLKYLKVPVFDSRGSRRGRRRPSQAGLWGSTLPIAGRAPVFLRVQP